MSARLALIAFVILVLLTPARAAEPENPIVAGIKPHLKNPDHPFTLAVLLHVKKGSAHRFETAFAKARRETRKEKGNLAYDLNRDTEDPLRYLLYERWNSVADLETHLNAPHIKALLADLPNLTTGQPEVQVFVPTGR